MWKYFSGHYVPGQYWNEENLKFHFTAHNGEHTKIVVDT